MLLGRSLRKREWDRIWSFGDESWSLTVGEKSDLFHGGVSDHSAVSEGSSLGGPANSGSHGDAITAIDEGIINPMALATWLDETTIVVTIINGCCATVNLTT